MCDPDLVQQHVQNERIRDTCASPQRPRTATGGTQTSTRITPGARTTATSPRASIQQYNDYPHERLICLNSTSRHSLGHFVLINHSTGFPL